MAVFVNMRNFWINPFTMFFNSILSLIFLVFYLNLIKTTFLKSSRLECLLKLKEENPSELEISPWLQKELDTWDFL